MDIKKMKEITTQIIENLGNQGLVSQLLTELSDDNIKLESCLTDLNGKYEGIIADNESLRVANNKLFVRLGNEEKNNKADTITDETEDEQELKYESLFNEKGGLI